MALRAQLFFRNNRKYGVGDIKFDLILSENHNFSNEVTEHNIEDGSTISDHIKNNPETGSVTGLITNFTIHTFGITKNRAQDAFDAFKSLWKERTLVTIVTVMEVYNDVAITDVSVDRSSSTGESLALNISFQKANIVKLKTVQVDVGITLDGTETNANRQASPQADVGRTVGISL